jgi:LacI family transcriptional regulator
LSGGPTLKDIAAAANVHPSTASRALHAVEPGRIPPELVERVRRIAFELGYSRNTIAASLRTRRSRTIGVIVTDLTNTMFPPMLRGIEDRLDAEQYNAIVANTDFDPEKQRRAIEIFLDRRLDGIILATSRLEDTPALVQLRQKVPLVLMNRASGEGLFPAVVAGAAEGIASALDHLHALGHRCVGHIAGPQDVSTGALRRQAFMTRAKQLGLRRADYPIVVAKSFSEDEGVRCGREILAAARRPTAILATNDWLAIGCMAAIREAGLKIPDDISVTGFNDMPFVDRLQTPLTTIRFDHHRMGYEAADQLLATITDSAHAAKTIIMQPQLIVRASTAPPLSHQTTAPALTARDHLPIPRSSKP